MPTLLERVTTEVAQLEAATQIQHDVANGAAGATVTTEAGQVRTVANAIATLMATVPRGAWLTTTVYAVRDLVTQSNVVYICVVGHVAGVFATDLAAGKWAVFSGPADEGSIVSGFARQRRGGTTAAHSAFTGLAREITVDTDKGVAVVHDGATVGGIPLATEARAKSAPGGIVGRNYSYLGAVVRSVTGVFDFISDAGHRQSGFASVTQPDAYTARLNYLVAGSKITNFIVTADDALAPLGVIFGSDVGTAYANILAFAPLVFYVDGVNPPNIYTSNLWNVAGTLTVTKVDGSHVRIVHPAAQNIYDAVVVAAVSHGNLGFFDVSFTDTQIDIIFRRRAEGYISYGGANWAQALSSNLTAPTLTWTGSNTLRVDHGVAGSFNRTPIVGGHGGQYVVQVVDIADTYFEVAFFDYTGTKITVQDTNMHFWYMRDLLVPSTWSDDTLVSVRRGYCKVPIANFSNVAGNNFWVSAVLEV